MSARMPFVGLGAFDPSLLTRLGADLEGREPHGCVKPGVEAEAMIEDIRATSALPTSAPSGDGHTVNLAPTTLSQLATPQPEWMDGRALV